jgi:hypothetical protein
MSTLLPSSTNSHRPRLDHRLLAGPRKPWALRTGADDGQPERLLVRTHNLKKLCRIARRHHGMCPVFHHQRAFRSRIRTTQFPWRTLCFCPRPCAGPSRRPRWIPSPPGPSSQRRRLGAQCLPPRPGLNSFRFRWSTGTILRVGAVGRKNRISLKADFVRVTGNGASTKHRTRRSDRRPRLPRRRAPAHQHAARLGAVATSNLS